jgi:hypothetical protein
MLREGPIPRLAHGLIEYLVGVFLIAAPFLLGYDDNSMPLGVSIATGVVILVLASITQGPTGLVHQLPVSAHVTFDFLLAIFLIAAPFLLGFGDDATPRNLFIALGVAHLLISIGTRYREAAPGDGPSSRTTTSARPAPSAPASRPSTSAPTTTSPTGGQPTGSRPAEPARPPTPPPAGEETRRPDSPSAPPA